MKTINVSVRETVQINKEYGPLIFASIRVTADFDSCMWVIERQAIATGEWIEWTRIPGQIVDDFLREESET